MPYTNNIPQATDIPANSQPLILANFAALDTTIAVDHVAMNAAKQGKHKQTTFVAQAAADTAADEVALYCKLVTAVPQLFMRAAGNGVETQMSGFSSLFAATGYAKLPGGLMVAWGLANRDFLTGGPQTIIFNTPFANCYSVITQYSSGAGGVTGADGLLVTTINNADFICTGTFDGNMVYIAVGQA